MGDKLIFNGNKKIFLPFKKYISKIFEAFFIKIKDNINKQKV